jgi:hypothetical protein
MMVMSLLYYDDGNVPFAIQNDGDEEFLIQCSFEKYADDVAGGAGVEDP